MPTNETTAHETGEAQAAATVAGASGPLAPAAGPACRCAT